MRYSISIFLFRGAVMLQPIPAVTGGEVGYTLDRLFVTGADIQRQTNIHTNRQFTVANHSNCTPVDGGQKPPERTHGDTGRPCKLYTDCHSKTRKTFSLLQLFCQSSKKFLVYEPKPANLGTRHSVSCYCEKPGRIHGGQIVACYL